MSKTKAKFCYICGGKLVYGGNNADPLPVPEDARVCNDCDINRVIPARQILDWYADPSARVPENKLSAYIRQTLREVL
ncbi:MAG: hypothetical protein FWD63_07445 [Propionibacteriaceae bacterium]|nr:hypothetical protein [Propionibacteriaceae bacterium]